MEHLFAAEMVFFIMGGGQNVGIKVFRDIKLACFIVDNVIKKSVLEFEIYAGLGNVCNIPIAFLYMRLEDLKGLVIDRVFAIALAEALLKFQGYKSLGGNLYDICKWE